MYRVSRTLSKNQYIAFVYFIGVIQKAIDVSVSVDLITS